MNLNTFDYVRGVKQIKERNQEDKRLYYHKLLSEQEKE